MEYPKSLGIGSIFTVANNSYTNSHVFATHRWLTPDTEIKYIGHHQTSSRMWNCEVVRTGTPLYLHHIEVVDQDGEHHYHRDYATKEIVW